MPHSLDAAFNPRSIAIIGASENPNKIGGRPLHYLTKFGFRGALYPVNPTRREVQNLKAFPDLSALPETPDLAIIAVPGAAAEQAVQDCAQSSVKLAIVMSSGFSESDPIAGKEAEARMRAAAHAHGMRIVGPNTQGLANFGTGVVASFSTMFMEVEPKDGPVAILSQSGALSVVPWGLLRGRGIGVRHVHATGNDCDVSVTELAAYVASDPEVKLLLMYLEGISDTQFLIETAVIALKRNLPIIALKSGRTDAGQAAARSHTGALANEDRVVDAFFEHYGIWRAQDVEGLVEAAELYLKGWRPAGRRLVAMSSSGAVCVMAADAASKLGMMPMAKLNETTRGALSEILPSFATLTNPIDLTGAVLSNNRLFSDILPVIANDPAADSFLISVPVAGVGYDVAMMVNDTAAFAAETGKPVVLAAPQPSVAEAFAARDLATFTTEIAAIRALDQFQSHVALMKRVRESRLNEPQLTRPARSIGTPVMLNEADSLAFVQKAGLRVAPYRLCHSEVECVAAWRSIGGPVAVKGCSRDVAHKSELGFVRLGIDSEDALDHAFRVMRRIASENGVSFDGVIVAAMVKGQREMMIGAHRDPVFGPVVAIGDGGKYVEALGDVRLLIPPFSAGEAERALRTLRIAPLYDGVRGEPPLDLAAFCEAAVQIGRLMLEEQTGIQSIDLNPIMVGPTGQGYSVAHALIWRGNT